MHQDENAFLILSNAVAVVYAALFSISKADLVAIAMTTLGPEEKSFALSRPVRRPKKIYTE